MPSRKIAIIAIVLMGVSLAAVAQDREKQEADKAAQTWLAVVDKTDYGTSWDQAAALFKEAITKDDWTKQVARVREPLGKVLSRKLKSATFSTSLPGAPDGKYVVIQYETSFANKSSAVETVTPMLSSDGQWKVSGYFIK